MTTRDRMAVLRTGVASPADIRAWSSGEVTATDIVDYQTMEPVTEGLFCQRIFGPLSGWVCGCARVAQAAPLWVILEPEAAIVCPVCGVETPRGQLYSEPMGHIELAAPMVHPWCHPSGPGADASRPDAAAQEEMVLEVLPVLPPDLRPMKRLDETRFSISHLNDLYRRVLVRNHRLRRLMEVEAPEAVIQWSRLRRAAGS